ncbi:pirin family protein [Glycomyces sp. L485]|uniref:pirin family protein n=1 Tax=Glycomyces sp. L485 TaxID=2909235 RepID=UPI001F4BBF55|nr:pirin family protein [Glycomyces sp. L485]MCH7233086.1 pirin family protein [Glycomyces sp. L485]
MSNLDARPTETPCRAIEQAGPEARLLEARDVPLGGVRAMRVSRTLPQRTLPTVGAWCFLDRFGPERTDMVVPPHPHTGLQTVTWPLHGEIRHRDSLGSDVVVRPSQLNLMTSGPGIAHSEISLGEAPLLGGMQLWVALPDSGIGIAPAFEQHTDLPRFESDGVRGIVAVGELGGAVSPATAFTPLLGAQLEFDAGAKAALPLRSDFEHAVLVLEGSLDVAGTPVEAGPLLYLGAGRDELPLSSTAGAKIFLLGGEPFPEDLVMWWNFVGRSHDDIVAAREAWELHDQSRFGAVAGHGGERIPAPPIPPLRLNPRRR